MESKLDIKSYGDLPNQLLPFLQSMDSAELIYTFGTNNYILADAQQTGGESSVFIVQASAGSGPPLHVHSRDTEMFYVLKGEFEFRTDTQVKNCGVGAFVYLPTNLPHTWKALTEGAEMLVIATPGGFENFLRQTAEIDITAAGAFERLTAIAEKFGIRWAE